MKQFTEEQLVILERYDKVFKSALYDNVARSQDIFALQILGSIYADISGDPKRFRNLNCGTCVLKLYKVMGELYYKQLEEASVSTNEVIEVTVQSDITNEVFKNKPGRPKKQ